MERKSEPVERCAEVAFIRNDTRASNVLEVVGVLDAYSVAEFEDALAGSVRLGVATVADLTRCTLLGTDCLRVLARARNALGNRLVVIAPPSGVVRTVLELCGFIPSGARANGRPAR